MPIYEYQCSTCEYQFDEIQKMGDPPVSICPKCDQKTVTRLVSAPGFQLKGTGWYVTDFRDKGKPPAPKSDTASTETKTESSHSKPKETTGDAK
jgi:putative FmdB family regulatory protein